MYSQMFGARLWVLLFLCENNERRSVICMMCIVCLLFLISSATIHSSKLEYYLVHVLVTAFLIQGLTVVLNETTTQVQQQEEFFISSLDTNIINTI